MYTPSSHCSLYETHLRLAAASLTLLAAPLISGCEAPHSGVDNRTEAPPNVILIFTDDQGTLDVHRYGSVDLHTPNMDRLADEGVMFTRFYAAAAMCTPSRASLLTGRYPLRTGLPTNAESHPTQFGAGNSLPADEFTMADLLQEHGYKTAQIGKWHLGTNPGPNGQGFDYSFGFLGGVVDQWSHFNYGMGPWGSPPRWHDLQRNGEQIWKAGTHMGDLIVHEAIEQMEAAGDQPFFLYLAFGLPHYPLQPYNHHMELYKELPEPRRSYAASITTTDEQIGRILERLDALGLAENTLVIFQSDHGHSTEARAGYGGGNAGMYRGAKFSFFEGGIRVPAMARMPGTLPAGLVVDYTAHGTDWFATIAEMVGHETDNERVDGRSLLPLLQGNTPDEEERMLFWSTGTREEAPWAVMQGDWKLLGYPNDSSHRGELGEDDRLFLSNLGEDPTEMTNLAAEYPEVLARLHEAYEHWVSGVVQEQQELGRQ